MTDDNGNQLTYAQVWAQMERAHRRHEMAPDGKLKRQEQTLLADIDRLLHEYGATTVAGAAAA
jgi:hypothetical protein